MHIRRTCTDNVQEMNIKWQTLQYSNSHMQAIQIFNIGHSSNGLENIITFAHYFTLVITNNQTMKQNKIKQNIKKEKKILKQCQRLAIRLKQNNKQK